MAQDDPRRNFCKALVTLDKGLRQIRCQRNVQPQTIDSCLQSWSEPIDIDEPEELRLGTPLGGITIEGSQKRAQSYHSGLSHAIRLALRYFQTDKELNRKRRSRSRLHEVHVTVPLQEFEITDPVKIILRA